MIDKKDLGGLVRPSLDVNSVVNVADKLLTQMIKETNITLQKNIIQKIQIGTLKVVHEKKIEVFNNFSAHPDDPSVAHSHKITLVKKLSHCFLR